MGASATKDGYNFAVEVSDGKKAELLLYRKGHQKPFLYRAASGRGAHWRDQFRGNHRPDGRKVFYAYRMDEAFCLDTVCGSSKKEEKPSVHQWEKEKGRLLLPSPGSTR